MITPNMPTPSTNAHSEQTAMIGFLKSTSGTTGSAARDSMARNTTSMIADTASSDSTRTDVQPYSVAQVSASRSGTNVAMSVAKPAQSSCLVARRGFMFGNSSEIATTAIAPTGRFTQKHARHDQ